MWLPQGWRVVRHRRAPETLEGISVAAYGTGFLFNVLLLIYGIGTHGVRRDRRRLRERSL